jgi:hypothetical protein
LPFNTFLNLRNGAVKFLCSLGVHVINVRHSRKSWMVSLGVDCKMALKFPK